MTGTILDNQNVKDFLEQTTIKEFYNLVEKFSTINKEGMLYRKDLLSRIKENIESDADEIESPFDILLWFEYHEKIAPDPKGIFYSREDVLYYNYILLRNYKKFKPQ